MTTSDGGIQIRIERQRVIPTLALLLAVIVAAILVGVAINRRGKGGGG